MTCRCNTSSTTALASAADLAHNAIKDRTVVGSAADDVGRS